jgi:hypothetical protein
LNGKKLVWLMVLGVSPNIIVAVKENTKPTSDIPNVWDAVRVVIWPGAKVTIVDTAVNVDSPPSSVPVTTS